MLAHVGAHPDSTATLIAESIGTSPGNVHQVIRKLRAEGRMADGQPLRLSS